LDNTETEKKQTPYYIGHRERMRSRLLSEDADKMSDCDLLEMVLMCAVPRRDVKPMAKALLAQYGSFACVLNAPVEELLCMKGVGNGIVSFFRIIRQAALRLLKTEIESEPVIDNTKKLLDYCVAKIGRDKVESLRIMFFDVRFKLIVDELFSTGTIDKVSVFPREILKRVITLGAASFVLVHNHPSGDLTPSNEDIKMTKDIMAAVAPLNVKVIDHVIVSKRGCLSFKTQGLI